jgi:hypothetical protein
MVDYSIIQIFLLPISLRYYKVYSAKRLQNYFETYMETKKNSTKFLSMIRFLVYTRRSADKKSIDYILQIGYLRNIITMEKINLKYLFRCEYEQFFEKFITQQIWNNIKSRTLNNSSFILIFNLLSYCLTYIDDSK